MTTGTRHFGGDGPQHSAFCLQYLSFSTLYADVKEPPRVAGIGVPPSLPGEDRIESGKMVVFAVSAGGPDRTRTYDPALIKRML